MLTDYGRSHPLMKLTPDAAANTKMWNDLPPLTDFNKTLEAKAGSIVLAKGTPEDRGNGDPVLLAYQRYGRGRAMAFASGSSWQWQMGMDHEDQTYELFWKQVFRWLVSSSPDPVMVTTDKDSYLPGETVNLNTEVSDKAFNHMNNARVIGKITDPAGDTETVTFDWTGTEDATYHSGLERRNSGYVSGRSRSDAGKRNLWHFENCVSGEGPPCRILESGA